jgi:hypothetical protein
MSRIEQNAIEYLIKIEEHTILHVVQRPLTFGFRVDNYKSLCQPNIFMSVNLAAAINIFVVTHR